MKPSRSEFLTVRGLRTHVRHWGREGAPTIFMVHGWMD
ncbi:MAG TPA: alpha/beta hydrolase, partial [Telluria sp.]|nr:alpha/beta hydrolase [Telluria sp.]